MGTVSKCISMILTLIFLCENLSNCAHKNDNDDNKIIKLSSEQDGEKFESYLNQLEKTEGSDAEVRNSLHAIAETRILPDRLVFRAFEVSAKKSSDIHWTEKGIVAFSLAVFLLQRYNIPKELIKKHGFEVFYKERIEKHERVLSFQSAADCKILGEIHGLLLALHKEEKAGENIIEKLLELIDKYKLPVFWAEEVFRVAVKKMEMATHDEERDKFYSLAKKLEDYYEVPSMSGKFEELYKKATEPSPLFMGKEVSAQFLDFGGDVVFITFNSGLTDKPTEIKTRGIESATFGATFFKKNKISAIMIGNHRNHWYQTKEMLSVFSEVKNKIKNFKKVITYGASIGGFASLAFSKELNANIVLAFSPQVTLEKWPPYKKYRHAIGFEEFFTVEKGLSPISSVFAFYATGYPVDRSAVEDDLVGLYTRTKNKNLTVFPFPSDAHTLISELNKAKILGDILINVANDNFQALDSFKKDGENWKKFKSYKDSSSDQ